MEAGQAEEALVRRVSLTLWILQFCPGSYLRMACSEGWTTDMFQSRGTDQHGIAIIPLDSYHRHIVCRGSVMSSISSHTYRCNRRRHLGMRAGFHYIGHHAASTQSAVRIDADGTRPNDRRARCMNVP